jgi:hypothetical protein
MYKPTIIALHERANIYVVLDERGGPIGSGTKEVCEVLLQMTLIPAAQPVTRIPLPRVMPVRDNIRSAIKI